MLEDLLESILGTELVGVHPDPLTHEEREVSYLFLTLYSEPVHELVDTKIHHLVKHIKECADVVICLDSKSREVDRSEAEVASARNDLTILIEVISDNSCTAAHIRDLGIGTALLIVLEVVGSVNEREIREEPLCRNTACELE